MMFGWDKSWLPFVPTVLGGIWFLFYWRHHRRTWVWAEQMPVLLMVSLITAAYRWNHDQVVLLPVLVQATAWISHSRQRLTASLAIVFYLAICTLALSNVLPTGDFWRIWMAPALLLGYLGLRWQISRQVACPPRIYHQRGACDATSTDLRV